MRVLVYAPREKPAAWVEQELANEDVFVQTARSVADLVSALIEDPPPRPQLLVVDLDTMNAGELLHLHSIREHGWFGRVIALGSAPMTLRLSLRIEKVIASPYARDALRGVVAQTTNQPVSTVRMPRITG
jgi:hypothetical protein